jgi:Papain-like cysteine protease AvrRpt2
VDVALVSDHAGVFVSQQTDKWCAVAGTQMVLAVLGLGDNSPAFQAEIASRIGEWESWDDSHNGGWGPDAVRRALAAYGADGYEERAYESYTDALRDSSIAISTMHKPVVMFPWWGAHTWVMTGYRADADPSLFPDAHVSGAYILDPWYPRNSSIWGQSDGPGNFEDLGELERNWPVHQGPPGYENIGPGWSRPEGAYPDRDGRFIVLLPTTPLEGGG